MPAHLQRACLPLRLCGCMHALNASVTVSAATPLLSEPVNVTTTPGKPVSGNMLDKVTTPPGTTESVIAFKVPGSDTSVKPGSSPVPVVDPTTGTVTGTLAIKPDGAFTFTPAPGFTGLVPPVMVTVTSSDGQAKDVPLTVTVDPLLRDGNENPTTTAGAPPVRINVLDNAKLPAGTTVSVASFTLPGSATVYPAGPSPVTVKDPVSGQVTGTVALLPNGAATFTPAAGFTGQAPAITYTAACSDGQTSPSVLSVLLQPGAVLHVARFG